MGAAEAEAVAVARRFGNEVAAVGCDRLELAVRTGVRPAIEGGEVQGAPAADSLAWLYDRETDETGGALASETYGHCIMCCQYSRGRQPILG